MTCIDPQKKVIIIGSGIGGLTTGIILSKFDYNVTIIEKNRTPGGLLRSYTRSGFDCPVGVHYIGSMDTGQPLRRIFDYMDMSSRIPLEKMGKEKVVDRYIFNDFSFDLPEGIDNFEENLRTSFPNEQHQITEIMRTFRIAAEKMYSLDFILSSETDLSILDLSDSLGNILEKLNCSPRLRSVLGATCGWIGVPIENCPIVYHHMSLASYLFSSWRLKCTGAEMADIFASRFKELGGVIILNNEVEKILVKARVVQGIQLKSGENLEAPIIIGSIHPKAVLNMLPDGAVKPAYRKRINKLINTQGLFSVHLAVDASVYKERAYNTFKIQINDKGQILDTCFCQLRKSKKENLNLLTLITGGNYEIWKPWENTYTGSRGDDYLELKQREAEKLINNVSEIFGYIKGYEIIDTYTPLTIRDWVNSPEGSAYGVLKSSDQFISGSSLNRVSIKGLYLAGQSTHAPGVIGTALGSVSTAKLIIGHELFIKEFQS